MRRNFQKRQNLLLLLLILLIYTSDGLLGESYSMGVIVSSGDYVGVCNEDNYKNTQTCCDDNEFQCVGDCITFDKVCNSNSSFFENPYSRNKLDCIDASDEIGCSLQTCATRTPKCSQKCIDLPDNKSKCSCYKGYKLETDMNSTTCVDVNECNIGIHSCSHDCVNLNGTFECTCRDGFQKDSNSSSSCYDEDQNTYVMFSERDKIYYFRLNANWPQTLVRSGKVKSMDYDPHTDILYWSNSTHVARSYIPGAKNGTVRLGNPQALRVPEFRESILRESIAIDWASGNLYWLSPNTFNESLSRIMVSKLDGRYVKTIIEIPRANSLVVDSEYARMFWASGGNDPHIGRAWLDGILHSVIIYLPKQNPVALTLDHLSNGRLYWVDSLSHTIYCAFKFGTRVRKIYTTTPEQSPISLDVFENNLYWVTKETGQLLTIDKFGKNEVKQLHRSLDNDAVVKVYHKRKVNKNHKSGDVLCSDQCSHLCLRRPTGITCSCPDGDRIVAIGGEIVCDSEKVEPMKDPIDCTSCSDMELISDTGSRYSQCACKDYEERSIPRASYYHLMSSYLSAILGCIVVLIVIIAVTLSFYKRDNVPLNSNSQVQTMSSIQVND